MPPIYQFIFFYVIVPYGAVISLGIFPCLAKRENVETIKDTNDADCPLTKIWTWLIFFALLNTGVFRFYEQSSNAAELLSSSYVMGAAYFLTFLVLAACVVFLIAWRFFLGVNQKNNPRLLRSSTLNALGVVAVFSMLFGSTFIIEFFNRAFLITH